MNNCSIEGLDLILYAAIIAFVIANNVEDLKELALISNLLSTVSENLTVIANTRNVFPKLATITSSSSSTNT